MYLYITVAYEVDVTLYMSQHLCIEDLAKNQSQLLFVFDCHGPSVGFE